MLNNSHIERIAKGDRRAFKELHEGLYQQMFYYVYKILPHKEQAEDIIQDTFILFWNNRCNFNNLLAAKTYLYTVVKNKVLALIRDTANRKRILQNIEWEYSTTEDNILIAAEICGQVQQAIQELPVQTRRVIELSMQEMTVQKISEKMKISPNTVKTLKRAGYNNLRKKLKHLKMVTFFLSV